MNKRTNWISLFAILLFLGVWSGPGIWTMEAAARSDETKRPESFTELAKKARPGVVNIRTEKTIKGGGRVFKHFFGKPYGGQDPFGDFFGPFSEEGPVPDYKERSLGSGFIIDREGYIVTNNHVIENADRIEVKLSNGKEYEGLVVGRDPKTDLALLKIEASGEFVPLEWGDSDTLEVGTWVVAIGSPFGLEQTVTAGIVSAKGRIIGSGPYDDFIQTDTSINPGNSGGPLINMKGEVVGINTAIVPNGQGIGFAIPINLAKDIINQLKDQGRVTRGWLGVGIQDLSPELAEYYGIKDQKGAFVVKVYEGEPADRAGIEKGDVIISVGEKNISSSRELSRVIADSPVGEKTAMTVIRKGKEKIIHVTLSKRKDAEQASVSDLEETDELGMKLTDLSPQMARRWGLEEEEGVIVTSVKPGSKADRSGIEEGDLIREINHAPVNALKDFGMEMKKIRKGETFHLLAKRGPNQYVAVKIIK